MALNTKLLMEVAYDGTEYRGWQIQSNAVSVQSVLEDRLSKIYAYAKIKTESSGRTDAGVHAFGQAVSYAPPELPAIEIEKVFKALNRMLPGSIRIRSIRKVPIEFHARFSADSKAYTYIVNTGTPNPFTARWSWYLEDFKHLYELRKAVKILEGKHDFSSFTVERKEIDDATRTIHRISVKKFGELVCITFIGDGFLYKMVRSIMGSLAFVGTGRICSDEILRILNAKNRIEGFDTAPAKGLFLMKVFYEKNEWKKFSLKNPPYYQIPC